MAMNDVDLEMSRGIGLPELLNPNISKVANTINAYLDQEYFFPFGLHLLGGDTNENRVTVENIRKEQESLKEKLTTLLNTWISKFGKNAKWEQVTKAAKECNLSFLAGKIEEFYKSTEEGPANKEPAKEEVPPAKKPEITEDKDEVDGDNPGEPHSQRMKQTGSEPEAVQRKPEINDIVLKQRYQRRKFEDEVIKTSTNMEDLKKHAQRLRVLIETVNEYEYFAVMLQLKEGCEVIQYTEEGLDGSSYLVGEWGGAGIPVVIIQTHQGKDGPRGSYEKTKKALQRFPCLEYIFAVGVCGGVKGAVNLGDVVVSTVIQDYSTSKIKDGKWINRSPHWFISQGTDFHHTLTRIANNAKAGMVLSGNVLMADAVVQKDVLEASPDGIAFEMEGHGIASACDSLKRNVVCMVVKGVSDHADKDKADNWQPQAALNAAEALCKAMEKYPKIMKTGESQSSSTVANRDTTNPGAASSSDRSSTDKDDKKGIGRGRGRGRGTGCQNK